MRRIHKLPDMRMYGSKNSFDYSIYYDTTHQVINTNAMIGKIAMSLMSRRHRTHSRLRRRDIADTNLGQQALSVSSKFGKCEKGWGSRRVAAAWNMAHPLPRSERWFLSW